MSTTNTQRELIDFLWDWTDSLGSWSKLLVELVTNKQGALDQNERQLVFDYFLQDVGFALQTPLPQLNITKPSFTPISKEVVLTKLSEIRGVNRLADDQVMEFSPNITVVYGNNGVGKTGYSRILKSQGYSFDSNIDILSNVRENQVDQSARLDFNSDNNPLYINWQGGRPTSDLNTVSVFNSDCVNISLSSTRQLLVTPKGFYLFTLVTNELTELTKLLNTQHELYFIDFPWKDQLHEGTPQKAFIDVLTHNSSTELLGKLSEYSDSHQTTLKEKEEGLKNLNKGIIEGKLRSVNLILTELSSVITTIKQMQSNLTQENWESIISCNNNLKKLREKTQQGIAGLAETYGLEKFDSKEFTTFLKSADSYIKLLAKENYPNNEEDTCVYCKQALQSQNAKKLVESYSKILNDTTQTEISKYENLKIKIANRINLVSNSISFHQPTFGTFENGAITQPKEIIEFNTKVKGIKEHVINDTVNSEHPFDVDYKSIIQFLESKQAEQNAIKATLTEHLSNLSGAELKLTKEIAELKSRKLLSDNKEGILTVISNRLSRKLIDDNRSQFNTASLSHKTTQAREELIAQDFQQKFSAELMRFRKKHLGVNLGFFSQQGSSRIRQNVANYEINKVLSEGEQKTIALCEFLTELQLDATVAPVIFDDPVNSLDHLIINDVAKRLVDLSKERQVVVFTHNVIFYNSFFALQKNVVNKDVTFKYYSVSTNGVNTGILSDGIPINKLSTYKTKLNVICNNGIGDGNENDVAAEGYDYLRTSLELLVSNTIFQEIVGRYRNNIMMTKFPAIKGDMIDKHKAEIDDMFGRASGFIRAHSHPEEQHAPPTMNDLKTDFERFKDIEKDFNN